MKQPGRECQPSPFAEPPHRHRGVSEWRPAALDKGFPRAHSGGDPPEGVPPMQLRLCVLGALIAALPVSVDVGPASDSLPPRRGETRLEVAGGLGEYALITRGCQGQVISEVRNQIDAGALALEHRFPEDWVVGVRGGVLHTALRPGATTPVWSGLEYSTRYVNPYVAYEHRYVGVGGGWVDANVPFPTNTESWVEPRWSGHLRLGTPAAHVAARWLEDVPLQLGSYGSLEVGVSPHPRVETSLGLGVLGPYDGAMLGIRGRVWVTREAALQIRAGFGGVAQYYAATSLTLRVFDPAPRR